MVSGTKKEVRRDRCGERLRGWRGQHGNGGIIEGSRRGLAKRAHEEGSLEGGCGQQSNTNM